MTPATARPVPTTIAVRTRGTRRSQTIASVACVHVAPRSSPSSRWARIAIVSEGWIDDGPEPDAENECPEQRDQADDRQRDRPTAGTRHPPDERSGGDERAAVGGHVDQPPGGIGAIEGIARVRVDRRGEQLQALREARPGPRHRLVVDRADVAVLDRRHDVPAGPGGDRLGGDAELPRRRGG